MNNLGNKEIMAKNIQHYLDLKGIDRNEMCRDLGFKYTTVSNWLQGVKYPRIDKIEIMARYFGITKADLVEGHSTTNPEPSPSYYVDPETAELADRLKNQPGMRMLFDASRKASPKDLEIAANLLKQLKGED